MTMQPSLPLAGLAWPRSETGEPATLVAALARNAAQYGSRVAFRERKYGVWQEQTWTEVLEEVAAIAIGLKGRGLEPGHALTVIGDNRPRLYYAMLAATMLKAFASPAFPDIPLEELIAATRHGEPNVAMAEDQEQVDKLLELRGRIGRPATIVYDDPRGSAPMPIPASSPSRHSWTRAGRNSPAVRGCSPNWSARRGPTTLPSFSIPPARRACPRASHCAIATSRAASSTRRRAAISASTRSSSPICPPPGSAISSSRSAPG